VYSDEVANLCASISSVLILSVAYIIDDVTLSCFLAVKEQGEHKLLNRLQKSFLLNEDAFNALLSVRISVRLYFIMSERLIDATSILHYELEAPPV
jgi:hypothetical protein